MMKLVFFSHDSALYGATRSMINLITGLSREGVDILLYLPETGEVEEILLEKKIKYKIAKYKPWIMGDFSTSEKGRLFEIRRQIFKLKRIITNLNLALRIKSDIEFFNPDFIISNTSTTPIGFITAQLLRLPHIWYIREFGHEDHGHRFDFGRRIFNWTLKKSTFSIFISNALKSKYSFPKIETRSHVIYNGLFLKDEIPELIHTKQNGSQPFIFLLLGQVKESKGHRIALLAFKQAYKRNNNIRLSIVGGGEINKFQQFTSKLGLEPYVTFYGHLNDPNNHLIQSNALLICSKSEAFGRVIIEAWAHGLPVIGNNSAGIPEIIEDRVTGLLYDGTPADLVKNMLTIFEDKTLAQKIKEQALLKLQSKFTIETNTSIFLDLLYSKQQQCRQK